MNDDTPAVSVVMAAYNAERFIGLAIESALSQTAGDLELIIVDDGSSDGTEHAIAPFRADPRVRYSRQENSGQCAAKNKGIELARGDFVAFLDADDLWRRDKLERQLRLFEDRPDVGVVYGFLEKIDGAGQPLPWEPVSPWQGYVTPRLLKENFVPFASAVVRRSLLVRNAGFDPGLDMGIDYDLWLRLSMQCEFDYVPAVVGSYRVWEGQMSRKVFQRYTAGIGIMSAFLARYGTVIRREDVRRAWAHTYAGRGDTRLWYGRDWRGAWADYMLALSQDVAYWPVYRSMARSLLTWRAP
jgi:glycosyltransferase involved in cell wall biosynthesis